MVSILSAADVAAVLDLSSLLPVVEDAFARQGARAVERPERPHFPVGAGLDGDDPLGTGLAMPAYLHGEETYATKLASVHEGNADRGLPTVNAQVVLTDARTGRPLALADGTRITNARTACIGALAARELAVEPVRLGVIGAGTQARWQARAIATATDVTSVSVYSPSDSRLACATELDERLEADVRAVETPTAAVEDATVVVTATTSESPVVDGAAIPSGALVVGVGAYTAEMQELDVTTFRRAESVFADVPAEVAETGDLRATDLSAGDLVPLSAALDGAVERTSPSEFFVVESVGSAVLDAATAAHVYRRAQAEAVGTDVAL